MPSEPSSVLDKAREVVLFCVLNVVVEGEVEGVEVADVLVLSVVDAISVKTRI